MAHESFRHDVAPPGVTRVYFIRHAQSDHAVLEDHLRPLTARGLADAERLPARLAGIGFARIYSSPYPRALQTVAPLARSLGLEPIPMEGFREFFTGNVWFEDFEPLARRLWADPSYAPPGAECLAAVEARNLAALREVLRRDRGRTVAVGTHGMALSCMLRRLLPSFGFEDFWRIVPMLPYVIRLDFDGEDCLGAGEIPLEAEEA